MLRATLRFPSGLYDFPDMGINGFKRRLGNNPDATVMAIKSNIYSSFQAIDLDK